MPQQTTRSLKQNIQKFRLAIASVIFRNRINTNAAAADIQNIEHLFELSDQYAIHTFINWIAKEKKFPAYAELIDSLNSKYPFVLRTYPTLSHQYPLYASLPEDFEQYIHQQAIDMLANRFIPDIYTIGSVYESIISNPLCLVNGKPSLSKKDNNRFKGEFYTPHWVVDMCLDRAKIHANLNSDFSILDPACGAGNFLLGAITQLEKSSLSDSEKFKFIANGLKGFDIDSRALAVCRLVLLLAAYDHFAGKQQLDKEQISQLILQLQKNIKFNDCILTAANLEAGSFDLIIGNPPYISFGSRDQSKLTKGFAKYIKTLFPESAQYKVRMHSIFQDIALRYVKEQGQVVLLLPDAFFTGHYYQKLRRKIANETQILSLTNLPTNTIPYASVGNWCISHYQKGVAAPDHHVDLYRINQDHALEHYRLPQQILVSKDKYRFQLFFNDNDKNISLHLDGLSPLSSILSGHTGIRSKTKQENIIASEQKNSSWRKGLTSGAQIAPFNIAWNNMWINIEPALLYAGGYNAQIIENPKILMRQTSDRIIAACDFNGFYHLNNIHSFTLSKTNVLPPSDELLHFFAGLMSSNLWLYLYQKKSQEEKRAMAQIDIEMVESMPLPELSQNDILKIALCAKILSSQPQKDLYQQIISAIDMLVYNLYKLSPAQIKHIEESTYLSNSRALPSAHEALELLKFLGAAPPSTLVLKI